LDVLKSENDESCVRRLRRFVVELCSSSCSAALCEFGFIGSHTEQVAGVLSELAASAHPGKDVAYADILFAFHVYRGNFYQAACAA
jgi:hypothetical protein